MQIMITSGVTARTRTWQVSAWMLVLAGLALMVPLMLASVSLYHAVMLKAGQGHWPIISGAVGFVERKEIVARDRFVRQNVDAMARKVGEMQARLLQLEAVSERLGGMAGLKPDDLKQQPIVPGQASGGPLVPLREPVSTASALTLDELNAQMSDMGALSDRNADLLTLIESRLVEERLEALLIPSTKPVNVPVGSGFGFRSDPFTRSSALHTGLDFPSPTGTPIMAAAGGVVLSAAPHPAYGLLVELDHGNGLVTRYAHTSKMLVAQGDLIKRGQKIAEVGSTGRSTGPHLHFEVMLDGVHQNPARFLAGQGRAKPQSFARR